VDYIIATVPNQALSRRVLRWQEKMRRRWLRSRVPQCGYSSFTYRGWRWCRHRRICFKVERHAGGESVRFLVTNLPGRAEDIFTLYHGHAECENRIAELKNGFAADRLSCHRYLANAFRLLLPGLAYNLLNLFRLRLPMPLRSAQIQTLRICLFKLGARIRCTARRVWVHCSGNWPWQSVFLRICQQVNSS